MTDLGPLLLAALGGYLLGSIPFGFLLTKWAGLGDIRAIGSGNIGATNVLRTGNKRLALLTLLLDGAKGAAALLIGAQGGSAMALAAGGGAMLGHLFPVWLKFKGGKGVATALGILLALDWQVGALACLTWLAVALLFRYSSLAALLALAAAPIYGFFLAGSTAAIFALGLAILVWVRHHENIGRLLRGEESRIGAKKKADGV
ncbi:MAG: glycerol-3-phosphate 1-O-acyltransferase PlsY [Dongiaceae bacterium]